MKDFTDNLDKLAGMTSQTIEPVRQFANTVMDASEELARKNYAVCGDLMEFALTQARLPLSVTDPKELLDRQVNETKAFADLMSNRASEYADMGKSFQKAAADVATTDLAEAAQKPRKRASRAKAA